MQQITINISDEMMALLEERAQKRNVSPNIVLEEWTRCNTNIFDLYNFQYVRASISTIKGLVSILLQDGSEKSYLTEKDQEEFREILVNECGYLHYILDSSFSVGLIDGDGRTIPPLFVPTAIRDILADVIKKFDNNSFRKANHQIKWQVESDVPLSFYADADKLNQIFSNLIGNAIKYSPQGGLIQIRGRVSQERRQVEFSIQDEGLGMTHEFISRIGERFLRVSNQESHETGGTGLGLFIAKQLIEAHGGKLWAHSDGIGKGSTFFFTLSLNLGHDAVATRMLKDAYMWDEYMKQYKEAIMTFQSATALWKTVKAQPLDTEAERAWNEAKWATEKAGRHIIHFTHEIDYYLYRLNYLSLEKG
jgi:signal transduction histidine kinase